MFSDVEMVAIETCVMLCSIVINVLWKTLLKIIADFMGVVWWFERKTVQSSQIHIVGGY